METQIGNLISRYLSFVRKCFDSTHGKPLGQQPYVSYLCSEIAALYSGEVARLLINLPFRHLKSFVCTVCLRLIR